MKNLDSLKHPKKNAAKKNALKKRHWNINAHHNTKHLITIYIPSGKLTYQWKTTNFNRRYVFEWWISHCYISLPECILFIPGLSTCGFRFAWQHHGRADLGDFPGFWRKTPELMISCPKIQAIVWVNIRKSKQKKISEFQLVSWDQDFMTFLLGSIHIMNGLFSWQEWLHINLYIYNWHHQQSIYFVSTSKVHYLATLSKLKVGKLSVQLAPTRTVFRAASDHIKHLGKVSQYPQFSKTWVPHSTTTHEWWNLSSSLPCWLGGCSWIFRPQGSWPC